MFKPVRLISLLLSASISALSFSETVFKENALSESLPEPVVAVEAKDSPDQYVKYDLSTWPVYELVSASQDAYRAGDYSRAIQYRFWAIKNGDTGFYDLANYYALDGQVEEAMHWLTIDAKQGSGTTVEWLEKDEDFSAVIAHKDWPELKRYLETSTAYWSHSGHSAYQIVIPDQYTGDAIPVLVALHGKGDTPEDFIGEHYQSLADQLNIVIVALSGVTPMGKTAFQWTMRNTDNENHIHQQLKTIFKNHNIQPANMALYGFSQGAQVALQMLASEPNNWSGALAMSPGLYPVTELVMPENAADFSDKQIIVTNGKNEAPYNLALSQSDIAQLEGKKAKVEHLLYPDHGHSFPPDFYENFGLWVISILDLELDDN